MTTSQRRRVSTLATSSAVLGLAVVPLILSGCSGGTNSGQADPVEITVQTQTNWAPMMNVLVPAFEAANPGIKVKLQIITEDQKNATNSQVISGSDAPDLALVPSNSPVYTAAVSAGALLPLDDVWQNQDLATRYGQSTAATLTAADGKPYVAAIDSLYYDVVLYNKALFDKAGVAAPEDHRITDTAELVSIAQKVRAAGLQPLALDGSEPARYGWMMDQLLQSAASADQMANYLTSYDPSVPVTADYTAKPFVDSISTIKSWADAGVFQDGYLGQDDSTAAGLFQQGTAAMYLGGNFSVPDLVKAGIDFDWALLPPVAGAQKTALPAYRGEAMAVPKKAAHPNEAKKLLEFWLTDEMQTQAVGNSGYALPTVNTVPVDQLQGLNPAIVSMIDDANRNGSPTGWTSAVPGSFGQKIIGTNIPAMLSGEMTVDQVAQKQQDALQSVRAGN